MELKYDGYTVYNSPEFIAFCDRFEIPHHKGKHNDGKYVQGILLDITLDQFFVARKIVHNATDATPKPVTTTTMNNREFVTKSPPSKHTYF